MEYEERYLHLDEPIDVDSHVICKYKVGTDLKMTTSAAAIATEQSTGTWTKLSTLKEDNFLKRSGKVTAIEGDVATIQGQGQSVLVVEDEPALRGLAVLMIERLGYKVAEAASGAEALTLIDRQGLRPDVLLTDVVIPGMGGPALAEQLKERVPGLKAIYMSGYGDDAVSGRGVLGPDVDFLQKPFTVSDLARAIGKVLGAGTAAGQ